MNVRDFADLAGVLSAHAIQIIEAPSPFPAESIERLKEISQKRSEAWFSRMRLLKTGAVSWPSLYAKTGDARTPLIEEILVTELLTRVVAGILTSHGQLRGQSELCRTASALFYESQEARRLALRQMLEMAKAQVPVVRKLDRLRRLTERWTDLLLGPMHCRFSVKHLTFDPKRSLEFGQTLLPYLTSGLGSGLFAAGIRVAFPQSLRGVPTHARLHRDFTSAVLAFLPTDLFEADGGLRPLRSVRASRAGDGRETSDRRTAARNESAIPPDSTKSPQSKISFQKLRRRQQEP